MSLLFSRRFFLAFTTGALLAPSTLFGKDEVPSLLDHILLGSQDLQAGIDFVESRTGVRATFGGVHPGRGTQIHSRRIFTLFQSRRLSAGPSIPVNSQPLPKNCATRELHLKARPPARASVPMAACCNGKR